MTMKIEMLSPIETSESLTSLEARLPTFIASIIAPSVKPLAWALAIAALVAGPLLFDEGATRAAAGLAHIW